MTKVPENLCRAPFSSLHVASDGSVRLCSSSLQVIDRIDGAQSLTDIWNGPNYQTVRTQMLKNEQPKPCYGACYRMENLGLSSKRNEFDQKLIPVTPEIIQTQQAVLPLPNLKYLDLTFSNTCNLACAMCSSLYSTKWIGLEQSAEQAGIDFRLPSHQVFQISKQKIDQILDGVSHYEKIMIKGGEPLIDENCIYFLSELQKNRSKLHPKLKIYIQTNGTRKLPAAYKTQGELPLEIGISIDGTDRTYSWIRGFSFEMLDANIDAYCSDPTLDTVHLNFTLSAFNIFNIESLIQYYVQKSERFPKLGKLYFSGIAKQSWSTTRAIPDFDRHQVLERLKPRFTEHRDLLRQTENVEKYLSLAHDPVAEIQTRKWIHFMDRTRGVTLSSIHPEFEKFLSS